MVKGNVIKSMEGIQNTMRTCMKNLEHQANLGTCIKNMEMNQVGLGSSLKNIETQMGQLAQSLRENPPKSCPRDTEKKPKQCLAVTLRSGKELDEPKLSGEAEENKLGVELNNKGREQKFDEVVPGRMAFFDNPPVYTPPLPFP